MCPSCLLAGLGTAKHLSRCRCIGLTLVPRFVVMKLSRWLNVLRTRLLTTLTLVMVSRVLILLGPLVVVVCIMCMLVPVEWVSSSVPVCLWVVCALPGLVLKIPLHVVVVLVQLFRRVSTHVLRRLGGIRLRISLVDVEPVVLELGLFEHGVALAMLVRRVVVTSPGMIMLATRRSLLLDGRFRRTGTGWLLTNVNSVGVFRTRNVRVTEGPDVTLTWDSRTRLPSPPIVLFNVCVTVNRWLLAGIYRNSRTGNAVEARITVRNAPLAALTIHLLVVGVLFVRFGLVPIRRPSVLRLMVFVNEIFGRNVRRLVTSVLKNMKLPSVLITGVNNDPLAPTFMDV